MLHKLSTGCIHRRRTSIGSSERRIEITGAANNHHNSLKLDLIGLLIPHWLGGEVQLAIKYATLPASQPPPRSAQAPSATRERILSPTSTVDRPSTSRSPSHAPLAA